MINAAVLWLVGVIIIIVGAILIGYTGDQVKKSLGITESGIWDAIAAVVGVLLSIIVWFEWLGGMEYVITDVITTAVLWIVAVLILSLGGIFIGYFQTQLKASLKVT